MKWQTGRQNSSYEKLQLFSGLLGLPCDAYLLRYREGAGIPFHTDPAPEGKRHFRLNITLRRAKYGGNFVCKGRMDERRVVLFRPDVIEHAVSCVVRGQRLVLSIGWLA